MKYSGKMDKECIPLCNAINKIDGIHTIESCCGHDTDVFRIWFEVDSLDNLPILLYYCDPCHVGFRWNCLVKTDCGMSPVHFRIESLVTGKEAYEQANIIAEEVENYLKEEE